MLVAYSSSESEDESLPKLTSNLKRKRETDEASTLPPLPAAFHDLYASAARTSTSDDPSLHDGRKRAIPHIKGNWPSHVYLEWRPSSTEITSLNALLSEVQTTLQSTSVTKPRLHSLVTSDLGAPLPLHISLSCPIGLATDQRHVFLHRLTQAIIKDSNMGKFKAPLTSLDWVVNETSTRWFLVLRVAKPSHDELNRLLHACNQVAASLKLPQLYSDSRFRQPSRNGRAVPNETPNEHRGSKKDSRPQSIARQKDMSDYTNCFHFSIAWTLDKPPVDHLVDPDGTAEMPAITNVLDIEAVLDTIKVKIGNTVTSLPLGLNVSDSRGLLG